MLRVLLVCWLFAGILVGAMRNRTAGGIRMATIRADIAAAAMIGGFFWLVWLLRF